MIPKKIRRTIIVNKQEWEYCNTGGNGNSSIFVHNLKTNEKIQWYCDDCDIAIPPSRIKELIEHKELFGIKAR